MENNNIFLGKIEKSGCYVNNGKYGYFLTCQKKNYKIPEWLLPQEVNLEMAKRLIAYKEKMSEEWIEKKNNEHPKGDTSDNETSEEPVVKRLTKFIKD